MTSFCCRLCCGYGFVYCLFCFLCDRASVFLLVVGRCSIFRSASSLYCLYEHNIDVCGHACKNERRKIGTPSTFLFHHAAFLFVVRKKKTPLSIFPSWHETSYNSAASTTFHRAQRRPLQGYWIRRWEMSPSAASAGERPSA